MSSAALVLPWSFLLRSSLSILVLLVLRLLDRLWLRPRRVERALRAQGLCGRPYRLLTTGNHSTGRKTTMPLRCHDIVPLVAPGLHSAVREHGRTCLSSWLGPLPKVTVADASLTREVMSGSKSGHFRKLWRFPALSRLLSAGLPTHEGEKWARHRGILSRGFRLEKLKLMLPAFHSCCQHLDTRWTESLGPEGWCEVDVCPEFRSLAVDAISRAAFGGSYLEGRRILELQSEQADRISAGVKMIFVPGYL
ncbi:hypothetical protein ACQ4PT_059526 [Festuca glaucescens]